LELRKATRADETVRAGAEKTPAGLFWFSTDLLAGTGDRRPSHRAPLRRVPAPPRRDALIAETTLVHGLTVVARNTADFEPIGIQLLNRWSWPRA
jgi:predicted nucleic acid-binding protein